MQDRQWIFINLMLSTEILMYGTLIYNNNMFKIMKFIINQKHVNLLTAPGIPTP